MQFSEEESKQMPLWTGKQWHLIWGAEINTIHALIPQTLYIGIKQHCCHRKQSSHPLAICFHQNPFSGARPLWRLVMEIHMWRKSALIVPLKNKVYGTVRRRVFSVLHVNSIDMLTLFSRMGDISPIWNSAANTYLPGLTQSFAPFVFSNVILKTEEKWNRALFIQFLSLFFFFSPLQFFRIPSQSLKVQCLLPGLLCTL